MDDKEVASEKKPLKSRFAFRLVGNDKPTRVEYLFDEKVIGREDWVALQNHLLLKSIRNEHDGNPSKSIFEMIFGR